MKKLVLLGLSFFALPWVWAQKPISLYTNTTTKQLEKSARQVADAEQQSYTKALSLAQKRGWFIERMYANGRRVKLQGLDALGDPIYLSTFSNVVAAATTRTNTLQTGGSLGLNLTGGSSRMSGRLGIWDGGAVRLDHVELTGRVTQVDNATTANAHATHVSGTMIASGVNPAAKGMATGASLRAWDFTNDLSEITGAASGLLISNHSYGQLAGWDLDEDGTTWRWYGSDAVSETEDYKFGYYDSKAQSLDKLAVNTPNYLICFSAGNSRDAAGVNKPADGASYNLGSGSTTSTKVRKSNGAFDNIPTYSTAKNILTVGAVGGLPNGINQASDIQQASFSSSGPTDDGRIKPDIMGDGVGLLSSTSTATDAYTTLSGTSMASPNVSGSLFLLQELYGQLNDNQFMRSSTLKGLVIHTAEDAGNPGPDYSFGWGLLNAEKAATVLLNTDKSHSVTERQLTSGQTYTQQVIASGRGPLTVTITWIDPEATPVAIGPSALNSRTPRLINDLDIRISDGTTTYQPYILDPNNPTQAATTGDNILDNVEKIYIANPVPGRTYTVTVTHKNSLQGGTQAYSLLMSGMGGTAYCSALATTPNVSKISKVVFGNFSRTLPDGCGSNQIYTDQVAEISVGQTLSYEISVANCNGQNTQKTIRMFADWNLDGDFDDSNETLATSGTLSSGGVFSGSLTIPSNVSVGQLIPLRIISREGTTAPTACGNYTAGQTQEYQLKVVKPARDAGVTALLSPENNFCPNGGIALQVTVQNFGTEAQTNVPVTAQISDGTTVVATLRGQVSLNAFQQKNVWLTSDFTAVANKSYTITVRTELEGDQLSTNNALTQTRTTAAVIAPQATAQTCGTDGKVTLRNTAAGTAFWYDAPSGGNLIAIGNATSLEQKPASATVYVSLNEFRSTVGPATKSVFAGGGYNQFSPALTVRAEVPVVLESARLYIGNSGKITFTAVNAAGRNVSSVTLDVTATRNPAAAGASTDDPNDTGAVYPLNLTLPEAGDYQIQISYANGATIYRNLSSSTKPYPFSLPNVFSITGNTAGSAANTYYYYLYDLSVRANGCTSSRLAIPITAGTVTSPARITAGANATLCQNSSLTLQANTGTGFVYQWYRENQPISGATGATFTVTQAGNYTVRVSEASGCETTSSPTSVQIQAVSIPTIGREELKLTSSQAAGYQWYRDGTLITGATSQNYLVGQSGAYTVQTKNAAGCTATSEPTTVTITAITPEQTQFLFTLQPNPAQERIRITYQAVGLQQATARMYSSDGKLISTQSVAVEGNLYQTDVDVTHWAPGLYLVQISDGQRIVSKRFIKN
ncbi:S8 family serine peptidase [Siphonobacter sp.]|uniref:S8 family serine peptidase n=1 Tax=Siphonobacter sp. TaxID=1869184 RepID=UPI003B3A10C3